MKINIALADLAHTKQGIANVSFPFGILCIASYAKKVLGDEFEIELFKYPEEFNDYLSLKIPKIIGFSNFSWTKDIAFNFNAKDFKKNLEKSPNCHYFYEGKFIAGDVLPRIENLDEIPSPYTTGLADKFFDNVLTPIIQAT